MVIPYRLTHFFQILYKVATHIFPFVSYYIWAFPIFCVGIDMRKKHMVYKTLVEVTQIQELKEIYEIEDGVRVGAAVTLNILKEYLEVLVVKLPGKVTCHSAMVNKQIDNTHC